MASKTRDALKILLADDHRIVRDGLRSLIQTAIEEATIVGEAATGIEAVAKAKELRPDVIVMDVSMPELNGIDAVAQILGENPECRVLALSMHRSDEFVTAMLGAGAKGYLHKDSAFVELASAIRSVAEGDVYLGADIAGKVLEDYQRLRTQATPDAELTARERQVLQLVAEGQKTRDIAEKLNVSVKTVETHRGQIQRKLGLSGVADLTRYAIRKGIVSLNE